MNPDHDALRGEIVGAVIGLSFANASPIEWCSREWDLFIEAILSLPALAAISGRDAGYLHKHSWNPRPGGGATRFTCERCDKVVHAPGGNPDEFGCLAPSPIPAAEAPAPKCEVTQAQRETYARLVEGDSDNPLRVSKANAIIDGLYDDEVARHCRTPPAAKEEGRLREEGAKLATELQNILDRDAWDDAIYTAHELYEKVVGDVATVAERLAALTAAPSDPGER